MQDRILHACSITRLGRVRIGERAVIDTLVDTLTANVIAIHLLVAPSRTLSFRRCRFSVCPPVL